MDVTMTADRDYVNLYLAHLGNQPECVRARLAKLGVLDCLRLVSDEFRDALNCEQWNEDIIGKEARRIGMDSERLQAIVRSYAGFLKSMRIMPEYVADIISGKIQRGTDEDGNEYLILRNR